MTARRIATVVSLGLTGMAVGLLALILVVGTLFFDDPHASYSAFLAWLAGRALMLAAVMPVCHLGARRLSRSGSTTAAVMVALVPGVFAAAGIIYTVTRG